MVRLVLLKEGEGIMLKIHIDHIGGLAVVECEGKLVQSKAACRLREAVTAQKDAQIVVLALSGVEAVEGRGLRVLVSLRRWARNHNIPFMLFDPSKCVRDGLKRATAISDFYVPTLEDMSALLIYAGCQYATT